MSYNAIVLKQYPDDFINEETFETKTFEAQPLQKGEFRVKVSHVSLDPVMRDWVDPNSDSEIPPVQLDEIMRSRGCGEVVESLNDSFPVGSPVAGMTGWAEQVVSKGEEISMLPHGVDSDMALTTYGIPGLTAFFGYAEILDAPERQRRAHQIGEKQTILVTSAAGAVGSIVVQMAIADGLHVVALAGNDEKINWLKDELGVHAAINYKTENVSEALTEAAPNGIDLFFENTGGNTQHTIMQHMNPHGKIAVCGSIADSHRKEPAPSPSWVQLIKRRVSVEGFAITDQRYRYPVLKAGLMPYLGDNKIKHRTQVLEGMESAKLGINMLFQGENQGKLIVKL